MADFLIIAAETMKEKADFLKQEYGIYDMDVYPVPIA